MRRRDLLAVIPAALFAAKILPAGAAAAPSLKMFKTPQCGCCEGHADYLKANGFAVSVDDTRDLDALRNEKGIPEHLVGCHVILVDGYVIEGHVPAEAIGKLLAERPFIKGISLPGMPQGSPGMSGEKEGPLVVMEIGTGPEPRVFWRE